MPDQDETPQPDDRNKSADHGTANDADESRSDDEQPDRIELEPSAAPPPGEAQKREREREPTKPKPGVPVEEQFTCPNCNAVMPHDDALVCLRCGFDMKALSVRETRIEADASASENDGDDENDIDTETPLCRTGRGDLWLPGLIGTLSALLLIVGYLAGAPGVYPDLRTGDAATVTPGLMDRLIGLVRLVTLLALMAGAALAGLWMLSRATQRPLGDIQLAAARFGAIAATIRLVTFINFGEHRQIEFMLESAMQAALFMALSMIAFAIKPRTALMLGGLALMSFLAAWVAAHLIVLAAG